MARPRKKKPQKQNLFSRIIIIITVCFIFIFGYSVFFPKNISNGTYKLIVNRGDSVSKIALKLDNADVLTNRKLFIFMSRLLGKDKKIMAGMYVFNHPMSMYDLILRLSNGKPDQISIVILEGWTFKQVRNVLDNESNIQHLTTAMTESQIRDRLKITYPRIEGLLYPSTYFVAPNQSDLEVIQLAYRTMQDKLNGVWNNRNESNIIYHTPYELLTMASLIQKETSESNDMIMVSTVFNNRIRKNMRLQDDPAVFYGLGNPAVVTRADFKIDTPYNTYMRSGLPPTPICIPSPYALNAAANPTNDRKLLYFVAIGNGKTKFSETFNEHSVAVDKYLRKK